MNDSGSITEFFYNIVPGSLFLIFLNYCFNINIVGILKQKNPSDTAIIFIYIVGGLFVGFLFQCLTKIFRGWFWNKCTFRTVVSKNEEEFDSVCKKILKPAYKKDKCIDTHKTFYLMDNSLRGEHPAFLPTHFSSRFAFWANIAWGTFTLLLLSCFFPKSADLNIFFIAFLIFSLWMANEHLINFYDSILKSYYMIRLKKM
ncbi:MAG: hypothetical protein ACHQT7_01325 [Candidatus Levyibacteriota bacterium]